MDYKLYNIKGSETSKKMKLNKDVYGMTPNHHCIYLTVKSEMASLKKLLENGIFDKYHSLEL